MNFPCVPRKAYFDRNQVNYPNCKAHIVKYYQAWTLMERGTPFLFWSNRTICHKGLWFPRIILFKINHQFNSHFNIHLLFKNFYHRPSVFERAMLLQIEEIFFLIFFGESHPSCSTHVQGDNVMLVCFV